MNLKDKTIAIIGLGYVGLPLAIEFSKHQPVIGFDISEDRISALSNCIDDTGEVAENDLPLLKNFFVTSDEEQLFNAEIFIVAVPTPIDESKKPDLSPLFAACEIVGKSLKLGDTVIFESTVFPGCIEEECVPILEQVSGIKFLSKSGKLGLRDHEAGFYCGYSPERVNPGDRARRLPDIKKITSGSTPEIAIAINELYGQIILAGTFEASSIKIAEAAKVVENCQRDLNIAFMNELSIIFDRMDIDTSEVLAAASTKWNFLNFRPGLVGGHCIGVDPYYLSHKAEALGYTPEVILAGRRVNDGMGKYAALNVIKKLTKNGIDISKASIGVLGITFKEDCPDIRNSKVFDILCELKEWNISVVVDDPQADPQKVLNECGVAITKIEKFNNLDAIIIAVAHHQYRNLSVYELRKYCKPNVTPVLADIKSIFDKNDIVSAGFTPFRF